MGEKNSKSIDEYTNSDWYDFFGDKTEADMLSTDMMLIRQENTPDWNNYVPRGSPSDAKGMENFSHFMLVGTTLPTAEQLSIYDGVTIEELFKAAIMQPEFYNSQYKFTFLNITSRLYSSEINSKITPTQAWGYLMTIDPLLVFPNAKSSLREHLDSRYENAEILELLRNTRVDEPVYAMLKQIIPNKYYDHEYDRVANSHQDAVFKLESLFGTIDPWYHANCHRDNLNPVCIKTVILMIVDIFKYVISIENTIRVNDKDLQIIDCKILKPLKEN